MTDASTLWDAHSASTAPSLSETDVSLARLTPQRTVVRGVSISGIGLHSGRTVTLTLNPGDADSGIIFRRIDQPEGPARDLPVRADRVLNSPLCTTLVNDHGLHVSTIEHLMAALAALGIDNALIEVDAAEVPIMDGSAQAFIDLIDRAGTQAQAAPRRVIRVLKPVKVEDGAISATLAPARRGLSVAFDIDFPAEAIGRQSCRVTLSEHQFRRHLARARTFCLKQDVDRMHQAGLALGGSLDNAIVVDGAQVLNGDGLRYKEEFVRHKALDAIGDLYMAGLSIVGAYHGVRSSHAMNGTLLKALLADPSAYVIEMMPRGTGETGIPAFEAHCGDPDLRACA